MNDRVSQLESQVEELSRTLRDVEARLAELERRDLEKPRRFSAPVEVDETVPPTSSAQETEGDVVSVLSLIGRTFLGVAGAYLLRALTSGGYLPEMPGVAAGLAYAAWWILMADIAGARGRSVSAAFHGGTAVLLAIPLIWETTARFAFLSPWSGAAALTGLAALTLWMSWRRSLASPAWIVSLGAGTSALALGGSTHAPVPFALFLVLLGVATLWLARRRSWTGLAWVTAILADLAVWLLQAEDPIGNGLATLADVVSIELVFFGLYGVSIALEAWRSESGVTLFAALQMALALAVGYGGAVGLLRHSPWIWAVGSLSLVLAAGLYGLAFFGLPRQRKRSALFFTSTAIPLVIVGSTLLMTRPALLWAFLALAGSALGSRFRRLTPTLHGAVYALAAGFSSGLLRQTAAAWSAGVAEAAAVTFDSLMALVATAACLGFPVSGDLAFWRRYAQVPKLVFLVLVAVATGGLLVRLFAPVAAGDPGALATLRTAVLATAALALAATGRLERFREARVLVYPVLVLGAVKLLIEDFPAGRPETLFVALAFYGGALILAPRLLRAGRRGPGAADS